jgi:hypothetical protein
MGKQATLSNGTRYKALANDKKLSLHSKIENLFDEQMEQMVVLHADRSKLFFKIELYPRLYSTLHNAEEKLVSIS